ncbi:MAG TPA: LysR family transcriptional regulator, partial [Thermoanaerobaculia bacterium]
FDDLALLTVFGTAGRGIFPAPTVIERDVESGSSLRVVGRAPEVKQRYYLVSAGRKIRNPIVAAIIAAAEKELAKKA